MAVRLFMAGRVAAGQAPVHVDDLGLRHVQGFGDFPHLLGRQIALVDRLHLALNAAQVEE